MYRHLFALAAVACLAAPAHAVVLTQWNFNSVPADSSTATGTTIPSVGVGAASPVDVTVSFSSGNANGGSSDPDTSSNNSGWQTTGYPAQGTGDKSRGTQYLVSTVGFENIVIGYDLRHSNTSSRYEAVQYTLNGTTWIDAAIFDGNAGDTWFNGRSVDLSDVAGADNNASFGFRVLATFAPGTSSFSPSNPASNYATTGTWRFDMVTVSAAPIPEPGTYALLLAGLVAVGFVARRRG